VFEGYEGGSRESRFANSSIGETKSVRKKGACYEEKGIEDQENESSLTYPALCDHEILLHTEE
jgi:hypothetical protein